MVIKVPILGSMLVSFRGSPLVLGIVLINEAVIARLIFLRLSVLVKRFQLVDERFGDSV